MYTVSTPSSSVRTIVGRVELYDSSTNLLTTFTHNGALKSFTVDRVGENSKFFGFGVCQKANVKLRDVNREILNIDTSSKFRICYFSSGYNVYPYFKVSEVHRDENTNELSITMYDAIKDAEAITLNDAGITGGYTLEELADKIAVALKLDGGVKIVGSPRGFTNSYPDGANFDGKETLREVLDAIAEATQTIYYIDGYNNYKNGILVFRKLDVSGSAVLTITKDDYFSLDSKTNRKLTAITHATELGDNVTSTTGATGTTQYVRNNPFWELRDDIGTLLDDAIAAVGGLTIKQFDCTWRGSLGLEIGDKINLVTKDDATVTAYVLNDVIEYNGAFEERTSWKYENNESETATNPSSLGDSLKYTYARVDKANKQIELAVKDISDTKNSIANIVIDVDSINTAVLTTQNSIDDVNGNINTLTKKVEQTVTATDVTIAISEYLEETGVDAVETTTGYKFDKDGLKISKSGKEMETTITEDGMTVYRDGDAVLVANNEGVTAEDLHASTYLIIGGTSRFENYGSRTGCFWIGG